MGSCGEVHGWCVCCSASRGRAGPGFRRNLVQEGKIVGKQDVSNRERWFVCLVLLTYLWRTGVGLAGADFPSDRYERPWTSCVAKAWWTSQIVQARFFDVNFTLSRICMLRGK